VRQQVRHQLNVADDELLIAFVGRDHPMKGLDLLLGALPHLKDGERRPVVLLAGSGTQDVVATVDARPRVIALGERDDVADLLRAADALVLPSRSEGTPNAVIEAMASAIPCVVTAVGDAADVVGETGIVVREPTVEGLVTGLQQLISMSDAERRQRGAAARERAATRFALDAARSRYRELWCPAGTEGTR
jgi:glycosyltransferase involved in cell wall biosynthesis